jgi:hypothetical protein
MFSHFIRNIGLYGGAIHISSTDYDITNIFLLNNESLHIMALIAGGAVFWELAKPNIFDCVFISNTALGYGNYTASSCLRFRAELIEDIKSGSYSANYG